MSRSIMRALCTGAVVPLVLVLTRPVAAGTTAFPVPLGSNLTTVSYDTASGPIGFDTTLGYHGPGASLNDIEYLPGSGTLGAFVAYNALGRRSLVVSQDPAAQAPNETLMRHGVYKYNANNQIDAASDFFAGVNVEGNVTLTIENITFDRPVQVRENTLLLHALWDIEQMDQLGVDDQGQSRAYNSAHNHHLADGFRNFGSFFLGGSPVFVNSPPNYALSGITATVTHDAPNVIDVNISFPYRLLTHLEDDGLGIPIGVELPAPGGFLEPWHFHLEYLVVPEPSSLALLLAGLLAVRRGKHGKCETRRVGQAIA